MLDGIISSSLVTAYLVFLLHVYVVTVFRQVLGRSGLQVQTCSCRAYSFPMTWTNSMYTQLPVSQPVCDLCFSYLRASWHTGMDAWRVECCNALHFFSRARCSMLLYSMHRVWNQLYIQGQASIVPEKCVQPLLSQSIASEAENYLNWHRRLITIAFCCCLSMRGQLQLTSQTAFCNLMQTQTDSWQAYDSSMVLEWKHKHTCRPMCIQMDHMMRS